MDEKKSICVIESRCAVCWRLEVKDILSYNNVYSYFICTLIKIKSAKIALQVDKSAKIALKYN